MRAAGELHELSTAGDAAHAVIDHRGSPGRFGLGIVRTVEWSMSLAPVDAEQRLREAMESRRDGGERRRRRSLRASSARSLAQEQMGGGADSRPVADGNAALAPLAGSTWRATSTTRSSTNLRRQLATTPSMTGVSQKAIDRLDKGSRMFGRKEVRHLRHLIHAGESVVCPRAGHVREEGGHRRPHRPEVVLLREEPRQRVVRGVRAPVDQFARGRQEDDRRTARDPRLGQQRRDNTGDARPSGRNRAAVPFSEAACERAAPPSALRRNRTSWTRSASWASCATRAC